MTIWINLAQSDGGREMIWSKKNSLKISDFSENIGQRRRSMVGQTERRNLNRMNPRNWIWIVITGLFICQGAIAADQRVAIFDYDDRVNDPKSLSFHIESRLKAMFTDIKISQYSGHNDEAYSVEVLSEIEKEGFDLVILLTSDALILAQHTLLETPTLYSNVNNPLILGFRTLGPPGGNISGASYYIPVRKHLSVYQAIQPSLQRPGFLFDKNNHSRKAEVPEAREACTELGLRFDMEFVEDKGELQRAATALISRGVDALIAASSGTIYENIGVFRHLADQAAVPIYSFYKNGVLNGALAALSSDYFRMSDELLIPMACKVLIDKVSPGNMPTAFLKKNKLFINRPYAQKLGLEIPRRLLEEREVEYIE
jgi:putative tryptophan/tyrosine transport system substrate-binding protein